ncbi:cytochrome-c peroxidase [Flavobacterium polysaccharolyticum]|uniref:Cytochrome c peroxidase n=1 Tax=Flavobacterium polysaccharolyticum TaxID=3133148 RepID=A0ABU9NQE1_9FLAO
MKKYFFLLLLCSFFSCGKKESNHDIIALNFAKNVTELIQEVDQLKALVASDAKLSTIQNQFLKARNSYKKMEWMSEYYYPAVSKSINGPAIPEFEENDGITVPPEGFQVVEEFLFPKYDTLTKSDLEVELGVLRSNLNRLQKVSEQTTLTDSFIFDALRLEIFRMISLGITGFDSPLALHSLPEAKVVLESIEKVVSLYENNNSKNYKAIIATLSKGKKYLDTHIDFASFDRAYFIKTVANPLSKQLFAFQKNASIPFPEETRGLKTTAQTLFDKDAFDIEAFNGFPDYKTTPEKIALGKKLFNDPILSGNNTRSCASCHHSDLAFTDGLEQTISLDGKTKVKRNTPTLMNIAFQRAFFYDSKVSYLEDQAVAVITNEIEMHGSLEKSVKALQKDKKYVAEFKKAFPKNEINEFGIKNALASYVRSLSQYNSKFDEYMRDEVEFSTDEKAGFNLFAGKAKCATCHFIPLTNGTVPPNFMKTESEILGVPNRHNYLDADLGKYELTQAEIHRNSFKTPTIRNIELTAPYMHNGVFKTLEEVIDFYNKGGGIGLGFKVPNQTLPEDQLLLSDKEKKQLIAFMKTLTDKRN